MSSLTCGLNGPFEPVRVARWSRPLSLRVMPRREQRGVQTISDRAVYTTASEKSDTWAGESLLKRRTHDAEVARSRPGFDSGL
jgi:hypothetical protein